MNPVQYIILDHTLKMSTGKAAAQAAHASQMGLLAQVDYDTMRSPYEDKLTNLWMRGGHYAKVVLEADDLQVAERYLGDRGFRVALIIDEGRTEFGGGLTPTAIGTGVVDKDFPHTRETFGTFKLYGSFEREREEDFAWKPEDSPFAASNEVQARSWPRIIGGRRRSR